MTIRKRIARLEASRDQPANERPPVLLGRAGMTDDDVIGIGTNRTNAVPRLPGESLDDLVTRARPLLATPWAGIPLILVCQYAERVDE